MNTSNLEHQLNSVLALHMGDSFQRLSPLLQQAHLGKIKLEGKAQVTRGNFFASILCNLFRFPKEGNDVHLQVDCLHTQDSMYWNRNFNGLQMNSHFQRRESYLVEHLGPLELYIRADEENGRLNYEFVKTRFLKIPMPAFLSPQTIAAEWEDHGRYQFSVQVSMFILGMVISYSGDLAVVTLE